MTLNLVCLSVSFYSGALKLNPPNSCMLVCINTTAVWLVSAREVGVFGELQGHL